MNRSNLKPTVITNKNGLQTTVYKKTATQTVPKISIPVPILSDATQAEHQRLKHDAAEALVNQNFQGMTVEEDRRKKSEQKIITALHQYSDDIIKQITQAANTISGYTINDMLNSSYADREYISDWTIIDSSTHDQNIDVDVLTTSLENYDNLPPQRERHYPAQRKETITAITRVINHLENKGDGVTTKYSSKGALIKFIKDKQLRDLLTTHKTPAAVADLIVSRGLTATDQILALLSTMEHTASAVHDGAL